MERTPSNFNQFCRSGQHKMEGDNVFIRKNGQRLCKICKNEKERDNYKRNKGDYPIGGIWSESLIRNASLYQLTNHQERLKKDVQEAGERFIQLQQQLALVTQIRAPKLIENLKQNQLDDCIQDVQESV